VEGGPEEMAREAHGMAWHDGMSWHGMMA